MRHLNNKLLRTLFVLLLCALMAVPAMAADAEEPADLRVFTIEESGALEPLEQTNAAARTYAATEPASFTTGDNGVNLIISYEGFSATPYWDVNRYSIGYGSYYSRAQEMFPGCTSITEEQALELLKDELRSIEKSLNSFLNNNSISVNQNQFDALASFTYNVGIGWTTYKNEDGTWCMLKEMLLDSPDTWTEDRVQACFGTWVKAGGEVLPGLVKRRAEEATLFVTPCTGTPDDTENNGDDDNSGDSSLIFRDLCEDAWYVEPVLMAYEKGFMQGMGDGTFRPNDNMTRAQMVQALANFAGADLSAYTTCSFDDVPDGCWYTAAVAWAADQGIVNGMGDGTFHPEDSVSREQMCNIMARYLRGLGITAENASASFRDDMEIDDTARENVYYCASLGLVNGMGDNTFSPKGMATRGQIAKILVYMDQLLRG